MVLSEQFEWRAKQPRLNSSATRLHQDPKLNALAGSVPALAQEDNVAALAALPHGGFVSYYSEKYFPETGYTLRIYTDDSIPVPVRWEGSSKDESVNIIINPNASPDEVWPMFLYYLDKFGGVHGRTGTSLVFNKDSHSMGPLVIPGEMSRYVFDGLREKTAMEYMIMLRKMWSYFMIGDEEPDVKDIYFRANSGNTGGQSLPSSHLHVITEGDKLSPRLANQPTINNANVAEIVAEVFFRELWDAFNLYEDLLEKTDLPLLSNHKQAFKPINDFIQSHLSEDPYNAGYTKVVNALLSDGREILISAIAFLGDTRSLFHALRGKGSEILEKSKKLEALASSLEQSIGSSTDGIIGEGLTCPLQEKIAYWSSMETVEYLPPMTVNVFTFCYLKRNQKSILKAFEEAKNELISQEIDASYFDDVNLIFDLEEAMKAGCIPRFTLDMPFDKWITIGQKLNSKVMSRIRCIWAEVYEKASRAAQGDSNEKSVLVELLGLTEGMAHLLEAQIPFESEPGWHAQQEKEIDLEAAIENYTTYYLDCFEFDDQDKTLHNPFRQPAGAEIRFTEQGQRMVYPVAPILVHHPIASLDDYERRIASPAQVKALINRRTKVIGRNGTKRVVQGIGAEILENILLRRRPDMEFPWYDREKIQEMREREERRMLGMHKTVRSEFTPANTAQYYLWHYLCEKVEDYLSHNNVEKNEARALKGLLFNYATKNLSRLSLRMPEDDVLWSIFIEWQRNTEVIIGDIGKLIQCFKKLLQEAIDERERVQVYAHRESIQSRDVFSIIQKNRDQIADLYPEAIQKSHECHGIRELAINTLGFRIIGMAEDAEMQMNYLSPKERHELGERRHFIPKHEPPREVDEVALVDALKKSLYFDILAHYLYLTSNRDVLRRRLTHTTLGKDPTLVFPTHMIRGIIEKYKISPEEIEKAIQNEDDEFFRKLFQRVGDSLHKVVVKSEHSYPAAIEKEKKEDKREILEKYQGHAGMIKECEISFEQLKQLTDHLRNGHSQIQQLISVVCASIQEACAHQPVEY